MEKQPKLTDRQIKELFEKLGLATKEQRRQAVELKTKGMQDHRPQLYNTGRKTDLSSNSVPVKCVK